jgi:hypothetical protein
VETPVALGSVITRTELDEALGVVRRHVQIAAA